MAACQRAWGGWDSPPLAHFYSRIPFLLFTTSGRSHDPIGSTRIPWLEFFQGLASPPWMNEPAKRRACAHLPPSWGPCWTRARRSASMSVGSTKNAPYNVMYYSCLSLSPSPFLFQKPTKIISRKKTRKHFLGLNPQHSKKSFFFWCHLFTVWEKTQTICLSCVIHKPCVCVCVCLSPSDRRGSNTLYML